jgi:ribosomal protein L11 methyltransferase
LYVCPQSFSVHVCSILTYVAFSTKTCWYLVINWLYYGCGSGILAIAAKKLGSKYVVGVDIDEQALFAARNNALMNQTEVTFYPAEMATEVALQVPADIVLANILAHPLEVLAPLLAKITAVGGRIALSGILAQQADEVRERYSQWFDMQAIEREDEWVMLSGIKKADGG